MKTFLNSIALHTFFTVRSYFIVCVCIQLVIEVIQNEKKQKVEARFHMCQ